MPAFSFPLQIQLFVAKLPGLEVKRGQEEGLSPHRPAALSSLLSSPFLLPPSPHRGPLPAAPGLPRAASRRGESRASLAAAPRRLGSAAEPLGDDFDGHNDAGGNHLYEDQSLLKALARLLPRLHPTLPGPQTPCAGPPASSPQGGRPTAKAGVSEHRDGAPRAACALPKRPKDPGSLGAGRGSCVPASAPTHTPTQAPPFLPAATPSTSGCARGKSGIYLSISVLALSF